MIILVCTEKAFDKIQQQFVIKNSHQTRNRGEFLSLVSFPGGAVGICQRMQETQETRVQSLDQEDIPGKEMATHSSILAWRIPMGRGAWRATVHGVAKSWTGLSD